MTRANKILTFEDPKTRAYFVMAAPTKKRFAEIMRVRTSEIGESANKEITAAAHEHAGSLLRYDNRVIDPSFSIVPEDEWPMNRFGRGRAASV